MAESPSPASTPARKDAPAAAPPTKERAGKPDLATLSGIILALAGIIGGLLLEKGSIQDVAQATAAMIVFGGTIGAVLITNPLPVFLRGCKALGQVFFERNVSPASTIQTILQMATKARKNGIVSLESEAEQLPDPFLSKALNLAVDGTDLNELRKMMETDIELAEQAGEAEAKVWEAAGGYAPTIGIIGAVMGLIQVMKHLEDIKEVGHGIAVAFVATVYGVGSANIFFLPAANKLRARLHRMRVIKEMALEGVSAIVEGLNPTLIRLKLEAFDQEKTAPRKAKGSQTPKPSEASSKAGTPQPVSAGD
ncbi:MAG TPA: flagellar motor protein [Bryobacteraceae bacterium]|nr:flagellar motor protein [Bryobacteraceae bacterium]